MQANRVWQAIKTAFGVMAIEFVGVGLILFIFIQK